MDEDIGSICVTPLRTLFIFWDKEDEVRKDTGKDRKMWGVQKMVGTLPQARLKRASVWTVSGKHSNEGTYGMLAWLTTIRGPPERRTFSFQPLIEELNWIRVLGSYAMCSF